MKKSVLTFALALGVSSVFAQDLTSKKGEAYLPEAGDYAIGIDATPFLNYFGNFFGKTAANTAPSWNFLTTNQTITGKFFVESGMAYRGSLRLNFGSDKVRTKTADRNAVAPVTPAPGDQPTTVENRMRTSYNNIALAGGIEWRKGTTRLQGFYGAELGVSFGATKNIYEYGNALSATVFVDGGDNQDGTNVVAVGPTFQGGAARITERDNGSTAALGVRGFIGAEFFILPKLALGGEFGWGLAYTASGYGSTTYETQDATTPGAGTTYTVDETGSKTSSFGFDNDTNNNLFGAAGRLSLTLHF